MSLDLGAVVGRVVLEDVEFQRTYVRVTRQMADLGSTAGKAATGTETLDRGLGAVSASADKAAASLGRTTKTTTEASASEDKAAAAASRHAKAVSDVALVNARYAGESVKVQQAALRDAAAQQRLAGANAEAGSAARAQAAETARLATAQASALGASARLATSQETAGARIAAAGKKMSHAITLPVLAAVGVAVDQAAKFQSATNVYVTAAGESQKNLGIVRDGIKKVAVETGTSIDQLTAAEYLAEKAHLRGADGITVLAAAAKGAREENANLADVMQGETSIMASYHLKASDAVAVTNALKTGAGSAKTTMEAYVKSLSTVIPVASAAGVSLQETLGALSTLTQHGTSADEATQELANTLRNLQAPNNVAVAAMNQLGISSVNVATNLGKRGLSGTIEYIESKLPKSGLVYLNTMRQMESGTKDLNAMLAKMPSNLAAQSKGYLDGSVSAKDYLKYIKSLGAEGYSQGAQFKALAANVTGYNTSLRLGTPAQKTMAAELKAMFGGATGLNTVLQLGGHNLDGFKGRVDAVGKSLHDGTGQVEGWASTSNLASVRAAMLKQQLHVLAIDAGDTLLPVGLKIVGMLSDVVHWISGLSHTDKEILGWSVAVLAAVGPVIAIGGRIGSIYRGAASALEWAAAKMVGSYKAVGVAAEQSAATVTEAEAAQTAAVERGAAAQSAAGARAAAGVGAGGVAGRGRLSGSALLNGGMVAALFATLGYKAAGSEFHGNTGLSVLGAVGGLPTVAGSKIASLLGFGQGTDHSLAGASDYQTVTKGATKITDAFTQSLIASKGAYDANTTAITKAVLARSGLVKDAAKVGLTEKDLTNAVQGSKTAFDRVVNAWKASGQATPPLIDALGRLRNLYNDAAPLAQEYANKTGNVFKSELVTAHQTDVLSGKLGNLNTMHLTGRQAANVFNQSVQAVTAAVKANGKTLDGNTLFGQLNIKTVKDASAAALLHAQAVYQQTGSLKLADAALSSDRAELVKAATQAGLTATQVKALADQIYGVPAKRSSTITVDTGQAMKALNDFSSYYGQLIQSMSNTPVTPSVSSTPLGNAGSGLLTIPSGPGSGSGLVGKTGKFAAGGTIPPNTRFTVGEEGWEGGVTDAQGRATIFSHPQSVAMGYKPPVGYASGTGVAGSLVATLQSLGLTKAGIAGVLGNAQIESGMNLGAYNAQENAHGLFQWEGGRWTSLQALAKALHVGTTSSTAQLTMLVRELKSMPGLLHTLQTTGSAGGAAAAFDAIFERSSGSTRGARVSAANSFMSQLASGHLTGSGSSTSGLLSAGQALVKLISSGRDHTKGVSATTVVGDMEKIEAALAKAGASSSLINRLTRQNQELSDAAAKRNHAASELANAQKAVAAALQTRAQDTATFKAAGVGIFDITTAGADANGNITSAGLRSAQQQDVTKIRKWSTDMRRLMGLKIFPATYLRELLGKGPDALPTVDALLGMSAGDLRSFAANERTIDSLSGSIAVAGAKKLDDPAIIADQKAAKFWDGQVSKMQHAIEHVGAEVEAGVASAFGKGVVAKMDWATGTLSLAVKTDAAKSAHRRPTK